MLTLMPWSEPARAIYLVSRPMQDVRLAHHYAVVVYGDWAVNAHPDGNFYPVIAELSTPGLMLDWYPGGWWTVHGEVDPTEHANALARLDWLQQLNPDYSFLRQNCEQFARFVATGRWESTQLQTAATVAALSFITYLAVSADFPRRRAS